MNVIKYLDNYRLSLKQGTGNRGIGESGTLYTGVTHSIYTDNWTVSQLVRAPHRNRRAPAALARGPYQLHFSLLVIGLKLYIIFRWKFSSTKIFQLHLSYIEPMQKLISQLIYSV